jgi:iron(III) transport system substrate-binding protein
MKRTILVMMIMVLVSVFAFAVSLENKLIIYTCHGEEMPGAFKQYFEEAYPGVTVEFLAMGAQDMYDRVKAERSNPQADIHGVDRQISSCLKSKMDYSRSSSIF